MRRLIVVDRPHHWPWQIPGVDVVTAKQFLSDASLGVPRRTIVFNLCRSYRYQSTGYYVSLLAAARSYRPMPTIHTLLNMRSAHLVRLASDDLDGQIQRSLRGLHSDTFTLSIYFGRNLAKQHDTIARQIFNLFPAPMLRAEFRKEERWDLQKVAPIPLHEVPDSHISFLVEAANEYFQHLPRRPRQRREARYDLAVLVDPEESWPPSNGPALRKFERAARKVGLEPAFVERDDYGRIGEFDGLFIRTTTAVQHFTFRFAQRAEAEGLVVIDDPTSILRCTNKVFLAELLQQHRIPAPKTVIAQEDDLESLPDQLGLPLILKVPDGAFSIGVSKVSTLEELTRIGGELLDRTDLILAQEFLPTSFDWRVGIINREPLYCCRYYMARKHWQIVKHEGGGVRREGRADTVPIDQAPPKLIETALAAANLMGDGLYGVDIKELDGRYVVIEVNDNPSIDAGCEDSVLKDGLYERIMRVFLERIVRRKEEKPL